MFVSIITANYNCYKWLDDCIQSVRKQNYKKYEHLILEDSSSDNSYHKIKNWTKLDKHIKIIKPIERLHCGSAYAMLADRAKGDIVCVLDADDALVPGSIKTIVHLYNKYPSVGYIYTQFWICNENLKKVKVGFCDHPGNNSLLEHGGHCFSHWRTYRRSIIKEGKQIFKRKQKAAVDKFMGYSLEEISKGGFYNEKLYMYRMRRGGLSYTGKRSWIKMKEYVARERQENNIKVFSIKKLKI